MCFIENILSKHLDTNGQEDYYTNNNKMLVKNYDNKSEGLRKAW